MKIGILLTTYNRLPYLRECLDSLRRADMPPGTIIQIVDDGSEADVRGLLASWKHPTADTLFAMNPTRGGIKTSLRNGCELLIEQGCDLIINLDPDALVRNDFVAELVKLHNQFPTTFVSGFECTNIDNGQPRHKIIEHGEGWKKRASAGGINLCFTPEMYRKHIEPILNINDNWDKLATQHTGVICASPSLIQHIGFESTMGHSSSGGTMADISDTFSPLHLPDVTLIGVDSNYPRLEKAIEESCKDILFADVKALNLSTITSKQAYSNYCIKHLYKNIETSHLLIIQYDGYVKNWKAWDKDWLQYDYIGAPWEWYTDGMQVGNGGFSLRSKRLMEIVATDPLFATVNHPEDHVICRVHRKHLEDNYGIKFAPIEVARKFSIEGYNHWDQTYSGQFGFHSSRVKFMRNDIQPGTGKTAYIQQYFGIGDVIFSIQIARNLQKQGYKICWPVLPDYVEQCNRAYPDITFMDVWLTQPKFMENKEMVVRGSTLYVPLRYTYDLLKVPFRDCMKSKYDFMKMDWNTWTEAMYVRDREREAALMTELGIVEGEPYVLINRMFRSDNKGIAAFTLPDVGGRKIVEMSMKPGFSLFDWSGVIERASEIHTVSTSIVYILELLDIQCEKCFVYIRKPNERNHENYQYIMRRHIGKYVFMP